MATDSVARAIALAGLANGGGSSGLSTIVAGTGTSSIVMNKDDANTNEASGNYSTALGYGTKAAGQGAISFGSADHKNGIQANGVGSIAGGSQGGYGKIIASDTGALALGEQQQSGSITASSSGSVATGRALQGGSISADSPGAKAFGQAFYSTGIMALGIGSLAGGYTAQASGTARDILAQGSASIAIGRPISGKIQALGDGTIAVGYANKRDSGIIAKSGSKGSLVGGYTAATTGESTLGAMVWSVASTDETSSAKSGVAIGQNVQSAQELQFVFGKNNVVDNSTDGTYGLIFGNGTADARANAFTLDWTGNATFAGTVTSASGADYAEYFEWKDGNKDSEDRVGYIVTLDGDKIVKAKAGDDILGIISGCATVIGDNAEWNWQGRFERDEFGRIIYDQVEQFIDTPDPDWEPNPEKPDEEVPMIKKSLGYFPVPRENAAYDPTKEYANRSNRPEWDTVGMMGKLYVRDDGTAAINDYVTVSATTDGVATKAEGRTSMRVMERVNDHIIRVCFK